MILRKKFPQKTGQVIWGNFFRSQQIMRKCFYDDIKSMPDGLHLSCIFSKTCTYIKQNRGFYGETALQFIADTV